MVCQSNGNETGIDVELTPGIITRISLLWGRILDLRDDDLRLLLDALGNASRLREAVNYILETYLDYNASSSTTS